MKYVLLISFGVLALASVALWRSFPDTASAVPVIYWVTDPNPVRDEQIEQFHRWLTKHGHVTTAGTPVTEMRLDTANNDLSKKVIQGVSGVAGDIWDMNSAPQLTYLHAIGLIEDVTEDARRLGYDPSSTYAAIEPEITVDGRQYTFPCNVFAVMFWVNKATFAGHGQPVPPGRWTLEEFERLGKQFVAAANPPGERQTVFFASHLDLMTLHRSLGLSRYNETLTECTLDDERFARCLALLQQWTYEDHLLPSAAEAAAFDTQAGYGGATFQLFQQGNYAMVQSGRYALIQFRKFGAMELAVVEPPHGGFPNTRTGTRAAGVYALSPHKDLAKLFQAYLASEDYNMQIVRDADALPPNPRYAQTEEFRRPAAFPNEWGCHEAFYNAAMQIAIGFAVSPFVLGSVADRHVHDAQQAVMANQLSPIDAARQAAYRINKEIERTLLENPNLKAVYDQRVVVQEQIDDRRARGELVPLEWISNPFYRRYYQAQGWVAE